MDILNFRSLREDANRALTRGRDPKKLIVAYAGINLGLSLGLTLLNLWMESEISGTGGLGDLGTRAILSTVQLAAPILASILAMCLELGYLSGIMRISRGLYADHTDLKTGIQKFWSLIRLNILQWILYVGLGFLAVQVAGLIFPMTPWAAPMMDFLMDLNAEDLTTLAEADMLNLLSRMVPMYVIAGILFLIMMIPVLYRIRMAMYCLLDDPGGRALDAVRTSSQLMRRRFRSMLKIDLKLVVYYLASAAAMTIMFADWILDALGIAIPMNATVFSLAVYCAGLVVQFLVQVTMRNKVEAIYLTAYDRLRKKPGESGPVVLGNIFDM